MKITIKTLQQKVFTIDADDADTVAALKEKIAADQGHPVDVQKLIYAGRVLLDAKTLADCEIKEKDFLVLMVAKPRPPMPVPVPVTPPSPSAAPAQPAPAVPVTAPPPAQPAAPAPTPAPAPPPSEPTPAPAPPAAAPASATGDFVAGDALQSTINNMVDMGFEHDQVVRALRASYNNPERAVEYLFNGIPPHLERAPPTASTPPPPAAAPAPAPAPPSGQPQNLFQLAQQQQQHQQQGPGAGGAPAGLPGIGGPGLPNLEALRNNPQMAQLREMVMQNPGLLQPVIQQLAAQNPQLAQILAQNPDAVLQALGATGEDDEGDEGQTLPPGATVVNVTPEEREAIQRLEALGFPRHVVIEAYFACDKNEELAANYLFEMGDQD